MTDHALSFWVAAPGRGVIRRLPLAPPGPGDVIVQALYSGVSRGTESLVFAGRVPASEHARMRAPFQEGDFPAPVKYGYSSVGRVEHGPAQLLDREVFCLYPHQSRYVVAADAVHVLPEGVPAQRAVLAANLETAINGVWDAGIAPGDRVSVVGGGTVGCLAAWVAAGIAGCEVQLVDVDPGRDGIARALGVGFAAPARARGEADVVLHASGTDDGLRLALELAGFESTVTELSWYADRAPCVPLGAAFHSRRLTLRSSQVGHVAAARSARWSTHRRLELALRMLAAPALDVLISGEGMLAELPQVMERLAAAPAGALMHRVRYD